MVRQTKEHSVECRIWRDGELVAHAVHKDEVIPLLTSDNGTDLVWLDIVDATPDQIRPLIEKLNLPPTEVEDAFAAHERPKISRHGDHLFFTAYATHIVREASDDLVVGSIQLPRISGFMLPHALVTIHTSAFRMDRVEENWDDNRDLLTAGPPALVHGLLDTIVDGHFEVMQELDDRMEGLESVLFEERRTGHEFLREVYELRKELVALRRAVLPMREVVNGLLRHSKHEHQELDAWYDDLYDHVLRATEWTESLRDMVTSLFETNLSLQDARLNTIMRQLAAWAAIIAVPTAITGWFGQNVPYPGFSNNSGLIASVVLIVALSAGLWWAFRKRGWLGRTL